MSKKIEETIKNILEKYDRSGFITPLTPDYDLKGQEFKVYEKALSNVFDNQILHNIAISGSYGIGKSSIIHTYEHKHKKKFIFISLMDSTNANEDRIEITILRQLLMYCERSQIPKCRFSIVPEDNKKKKITSYILSIYICIIIALFFSDKLSGVVHSIGIDLKGKGLPYLYFAFFVFSFLLIFYLIPRFLKYFKFKELNLTLSGGDAEATSSTSTYEESVFDEYRFDLIYVLEELSKEYSAIVFEDMDRLPAEKCVGVFQHLREINIGLNSRKKVSRTPLRFFYVINDNVMSEINHTKFFDYTLTVVPSIGMENAREKFKKIVVKDMKINLTERDEECINNAISYSIALKDYRMLRQIKNDYALFLEIENSTGVELNKYHGALLAFVIYKNICPRDYYLIRERKSLFFPEFPNITGAEGTDEWKNEWKKWNKERYGEDDNTEPHLEDKAIFSLRPLLNNCICLKFLGYSRIDRKECYSDELDSGSAEIIKRRLSEDDDFILGELLVDKREAIKNETVNDWFLYLIRNFEHYNNENNSTAFEAFIQKAQNMHDDNQVLTSDMISELWNKILASKMPVEIRKFAIRCSLTPALEHAFNETNAYDWIYHNDKSILRKIVSFLDGLREEQVRIILDHISSTYKGEMASLSEQNGNVRKIISSPS